MENVDLNNTLEMIILLYKSFGFRILIYNSYLFSVFDYLSNTAWRLTQNTTLVGTQLLKSKLLTSLVKEKEPGRCSRASSKQKSSCGASQGSFTFGTDMCPSPPTQRTSVPCLVSGAFLSGLFLNGRVLRSVLWVAE